MLIVSLLIALAEAPNPRSAELFEAEPVLKAWALRDHDRNGDGWLTLYEADDAALAFKALADSDRDGRVTVGEYRAAKAFIASRFGLTD